MTDKYYMDVHKMELMIELDITDGKYEEALKLLRELKEYRRQDNDRRTDN